MTRAARPHPIEHDDVDGPDVQRVVQRVGREGLLVWRAEAVLERLEGAQLLVTLDLRPHSPQMFLTPSLAFATHDASVWKVPSPSPRSFPMIYTMQLYRIDDICAQAQPQHFNQPFMTRGVFM